jgi:hypothetical protein
MWHGALQWRCIPFLKWRSALKFLQCHVFTPCLTTPTVIHSSVNLNIKVKIHPLLTCDIMNLLLTHCISSSVVYVAWSTTMTMHSFPEVEKCIEVLAMSRIYAMSNYSHCHIIPLSISTLKWKFIPFWHVILWICYSHTAFPLPLCMWHGALQWRCIPFLKWRSALKFLQCHVFTPCLYSHCHIIPLSISTLKWKFIPFLTCNIYVLLTNCISVVLSDMKHNNKEKEEECIFTLKIDRPGKRENHSGGYMYV